MKREMNLPEKREPVNWKDEIISWIKIIITAASIALLINNFIIANSKVPSGSMENTIMTGDRVIGFRLSYYFGDPKRGDITIFHFPGDPTGKTYYVKRIIGIPGDIIDIRNGNIYLNHSETPLEEPYLPEPMIPEPDAHYEVPEGCYFMLGDNRNSSGDARRWVKTYVEKDKIIAKVLIRYFPSIKIIK